MWRTRCGARVRRPRKSPTGRCSARSWTAPTARCSSSSPGRPRPWMPLRRISTTCWARSRRSSRRPAAPARFKWLRRRAGSDNLRYLFRAGRHAARLSPGEHAFALMTSRFLEALRERVLFFDGGMGTQLQARELSADDFGGKRWEGCNDYLSLTRPDVVEGVHAAYFEAGADCVETN